ncbi:MAG: branched-chain amino acid ABC transporter permease, partial [Planctomycetaceae bacterium]
EGMTRAALERALKAGLLGGTGIVYFALVGMIERLDELAIAGAVITLDWLLVLGPPLVAAYVVLRPRIAGGERRTVGWREAAACGAVVGVTSGALVAAGVGLVEWIGVDTVRSVFRSVSPGLIDILTLHRDTVPGLLLLGLLLTTSALVGAMLQVLAPHLRRAVANGVAAVFVLGLLQRIVPPALDQMHIPREWLYSPVTLGLTVGGAIAIFLIAAGITVALRGRRLMDVLRGTAPPRPSVEGDTPPAPPARTGRARTVDLVARLLLAALLIALPRLVGDPASQVLGYVGIYLLLGLGLNIVVGYAGLLDLGYVAFFSIGAYLTAILTGGQRVTFTGLQPPAFGANLTFYSALPIVICAAALLGLLIGAPVLRLRGDYLAIVTLGFGEIARVIFGSTWAQSLFGGSAGMTAIADARIGSYDFRDVQHFYYLALAFCLLGIFVSWRLQGSRIGRAWNAMREDEQVAEAMGISTIRFKLLAFAIGGAVGSVGGALFAVSIGSLTIQSFTVLVSITALAIVILGGLGSIPGVVVGALVLIGLPGVLSELEDYQLLIYGAVLIAIMILRPQGLIPNVRRSRELHEEERSQDAWMRPVEEGEEPVARGIEV